MRTVWITGAGGFTAGHLIDHLRGLSEPLRVVGLGRGEDCPHPVDRYLSLEVTDPASVAAAIGEEPPDRVVHLAAVTPPCAPADLWHVNVGGTNHLLRGLADAGLADVRVLVVGSAAEYRHRPDGRYTETDPTGGETPYGQSKSAQVAWALAVAGQTGLDVVVARPFNLIGPGLPERWVAATLCRQFARGGEGPITMGRLDSERDFIDVRDCVRAYWGLLEHGERGRVYNVCSGIPTSIADLAERLRRLSGSRREIVMDPSRLRAIDLDRVYGSHERIHRAIGWRPTIPLEDSLADMLSAEKGGGR